MKNYFKKVLRAVPVAIALSSGAHAQIPVTVTTDVPATANQLETMAQWAAQLESMANQYEQLQTTYSSMQGVRGMAQLVNNPLARKYLPGDYQQTLSLINGAGNSTYGDLSSKMTTLRDAAKLIDASSLNGIGSGSNVGKLFTSQQNQNATNRAIAETSYSQISDHYENIQTLLDKVDDAPDAKDVADLQARIQAEQAMLANEQSKIQTSQQLASAQDQILAQQRAEISVRASQGEAPRF